MKFSIRDLLWLMVVAALVVGWWRERSTAIRAQGEVQATRKEMAVARDKALKEAMEARSVLEAYQHHLKCPIRPV